MEQLPPKPKLERQERIGQHGEIISELTPESEVAYAKWLRDVGFARRALHKSLKEK